MNSICSTIDRDICHARFPIFHAMCIPILPAPRTPPHNVIVQRLPNGNAMNVSFVRLSLVEVRSLNVTYTVRYSHRPIRKRQSTAVEVAVPDQQSYVVITGLDPHTTYHVVVVVSNGLGNMSSTSHIIKSGTCTVCDLWPFEHVLVY